MASPNDEKTDGLPIIEAPTYLFEKIIRKLKHKSYARLQMTCKSMAEFAQATTIIPKYEHIDAKLAWHTERDCFCLADSDGVPLVPLNREPLVKETRYKKIKLSGEGCKKDLDITELLKFLEKNRISCVELDVRAHEKDCNYESERRLHLSSVGWLNLLGILKPEEIITLTDYRRLIDIFINYPNKLAEIGLDGRSGEIKYVLTRLTSVKNIWAYWLGRKQDQCIYEETHPYGRKMIEFLDSEYAKNLREFHYIYDLTYDNRFQDVSVKDFISYQVMENFYNFSPTIQKWSKAHVVEFPLRHGKCAIYAYFNHIDYKITRLKDCYLPL